MAKKFAMQYLTQTSLLRSHISRFFFLQSKMLVLAALVAGASAFAPAARPFGRTASLNMAADNIEERVRSIVQSQLDVKGDFENAAGFMADLDADSLDAVELIMAFEEEFEIEIPEEDVESITTVQAAIDFIEKST